jgi:hypothetical protein
VEVKAKEFGLKKQEFHPWSYQEIARLKKMYPGNSAPDIASQLGRSVKAVRNKAIQLGLRKYRTWSKRELNLLKRLYPSKTTPQIAAQIGRTIQATRRKTFKLGLKKRLRYEERHRVVNSVREKLCIQCGEWKDESLFARDPNSRDGLVAWCKECVNKTRRKQQQ